PALAFADFDQRLAKLALLAIDDVEEVRLLRVAESEIQHYGHNRVEVAAVVVGFDKPQEPVLAIDHRHHPAMPSLVDPVDVPCVKELDELLDVFLVVETNGHDDGRDEELIIPIEKIPRDARHARFHR